MILKVFSVTCLSLAVVDAQVTNELTRWLQENVDALADHAMFDQANNVADVNSLINLEEIEDIADELDSQMKGLENGAPERWTPDLNQRNNTGGRPWSKNYSLLRRMMKNLLSEVSTLSEEEIYQFPQMLRGYGCWCNSRGDRDFSNGRGPSQGPIDSLCKRLAQCKTCILMGNPECNILDTAYKSELVENNGQADIICKNAPGSCAQQICECDSHWMKEIVNAIIQGAYQHKNSSRRKYAQLENEPRFDFTATCIKPKTDILHTPTECCGEMPFWRPHDTQGGQNAGCQ